MVKWLPVTLFLRPRSKFWQSRIEINKQVYQFSTKTTNKNTARSVEAAYRTDKLKGTGRLSAPTLSEFSAQFTKSLPGRVAKQTIRYYTTHWRPLIDADSPLGNCRIDRIGPADIEKFIQWRRKELAVATVNHNLRCLRRALHLAHDWGLIAKVPKVRLLPGENHREYVISDADIERFAALPGHMGRIVPFLVDTGLRREEICRLKWTNVNLAERWIFIAVGKTKAARRRIPLTDRALKILEGRQRWDNKGFVFGYEGHGLHIDWISREFRRERIGLGLPEECSLHNCRHTAATRAAKAGASPFVLQKMFGWATIQMAMRYCHPDQDQLERVVRGM